MWNSNFIKAALSSNLLFNNKKVNKTLLCCEKKCIFETPIVILTVFKLNSNLEFERNLYKKVVEHYNKIKLKLILKISDIVFL